jgi:uncharacterized protein YegL
MKDDFVAIALVVDRSGSMEAIKDDTIGGMNAFIEKNREEKIGETRISIAQFDHEYKLSVDFVNIDDVKKVNRNTYRPRGSTSLLDAIGKTIDDLGKKLSDMKEEDRPSKVIVAIITDGEENTSRKYNIDQINSMIRTQEDVYNWSVMFLGAGINAVDVAKTYGINPSRSLSYQTKSIDTAFTTMANATVRAYTGASMDFTEEEREVNS